MKKTSKPVQQDGHDHEAELVLGTNKADVIVTGGGPQHILASNGKDIVFAGGGPDIVEAGNGKDIVRGEGGPDTVDGGNGKDMLVGGPGPDVLVGGNGKDVLTGGIGPDMLTGGRGPDTFVYLTHADAPAHGGDDGHDDGGHDDGGHEDGGHDDGGHDDGGGSGPRLETITDFEPGLDHIDLSALGVTTLADDASAYAVWLVQDGEDTVVKIDLDGMVGEGHAAEMSILLLGVDAGMVTASDFIFA